MPAAPPGSLASDALPPDQPMIGINPPSFGSSFRSAYDALSRTQGIDARWGNQADWMDDQLDAYRQKTGERLVNPMRLLDQSTAGQTEQENQQKFAKAGMQYPTEDQIAAGGIDKARKAGQTDALLAAGPQTFGSRLGGLAGNIAETSNPVDQPLNAAAMALAPEGGLLMRAAGVGAGFAVGSAAQGAATYSYQHQVNPNVTPGTIAKEALGAGLTGAGMELGLGALGAAWRHLTATAPEVAARAPLAAHDTGVIAEKAEDLQAQQPFKGMSASIAHNDAVVAAEKALTEGRPFELPGSAQDELQRPRAVDRLTEDYVKGLEDHPDPHIQDIGGALRDVMPEWNAMQDRAGRGDLYDVTDQLREAVDGLQQKWAGNSTPEAIPSDLSQRMAGAFYKDIGMTKPADREGIAQNLRDYLAGHEEPVQPVPAPGPRGENENVIDMTARRQAEVSPDLSGSVQAEVERMRDQGQGTIFTADKDGNIVEDRIDRHLAEIERFSDAAKEVRACAAPVVEAAE